MRLIRVREAVKIYGISKSTFYHWSCEGRFSNIFKRFGRILYIDDDKFREIIKKGDKTRRKSATTLLVMGK